MALFHASGSIFYPSKYYGEKPFGRIFDAGFSGVDFFFVLSGFIMVHVHGTDLGHPARFAHFIWKRFIRIYPVYWMVLSLLIPAYMAIPSFGNGKESDFWVVLCSILLIPPPDGTHVLSVAWTLNFEVFFHLLFGLGILHRSLGLPVMAGWGAAVVAHAVMLPGHSSFVFNLMNLRLLAGIAVGFYLSRRRAPWPILTALLGASIYALTFWCVAFTGNLSDWRQCAGFTSGSALMLLGLVSMESSGMIRITSWLIQLGDASYSVYLTHFPLLSCLAKLLKQLQADRWIPIPILFVGTVIVAIAAGLLFHRWIEVPILNRARRWMRPEAPE